MLTDEDIKRIEELFDRKLEGLANMIVHKLRAFENVSLDAQFHSAKSLEELKQWSRAEFSARKQAGRRSASKKPK